MHDATDMETPSRRGAVPAGSAWRIERCAALAWPAAVTEEHEGWLLRHSSGVTRRRSNSALPPPAPVRSIEHVERFYRDRGAPVRVQISPAEHHRELDARLAGLGYRVESGVAVLTARTGDVVAATARATAIPAAEVRADAAPAVPVVEVAGDPGGWLAVFADLDGHSDSETVGREVISRIAGPAAFLSVSHEGRAAAMGMVVADSGWAGVFCMATRPDLRRRGLAAAVLGAGARWAAGQGADRLYLQVEKDNLAARALYERVGFTYSHGYHFRTSP
ncbi:GNAT family N-acetyltransferase [Streptosporangium pseudovulgare]|uniref:N-acetyltransferase GCN5 n=1 Tax=Streptosporangium pseudovulgare TaxID=35765 RepID=A0ABQ2R313_9ACTN|nr:GNAT family N-acetyltransferase [Streptosporangium pseudovulgare]GGQ05364.1 N-acetyltransferase GCN5 [Streptosporangium pseudovulgare]